MRESFAATQEVLKAESQDVSRSTPTGAEKPAMTVKEMEIANSGLQNLVQVTPNSKDKDNCNSPSRQLELFSPTVSLPKENNCLGTWQGGLLSELNRWETKRQEEEEEIVFFSGGEDDDNDSDDDLL